MGRAEQVSALQRLLATERLVTLVGPGGVGKTRVALEIAYATEVAGVLLLAPLADRDGIPHALATALQVNVVHGDVLAACAAVLGDRPALLVIDNCEHLIDGVRDTVTTLLSACARLTVLATSREPLGLAAEYTSRLAPLPLPGGIPGEDPFRVPSVRLFLDRARRVRPDVARTPEYLRDVADIVCRLDGIPLAIELAAGRLSTFSTRDLRDRLGRSLDLLGGGQASPDLRHRTLRATIKWSYDLLDDDEQRMFRHVAAFADGIDLHDAERLAAALGLSSDPGAVLARLVDASMLDVVFGDGTRYRMLETIRAFGVDRLRATSEAETANEYVIRWAVDFTAGIAAAMTTPREPQADAALRRELANLRAAWRLARQQKSLDAAADIVVGLFDAVGYRDLLEFRRWARDLGGDPALIGHPSASAVLGVAAEATYHAGDYPHAGALARTGLGLATDDAQAWYCLTSLSVADLARGAFTEAVEHALAAAAIAGLVREGLGIAALALAYAGDLRRARTLGAQQEAGALSPTMQSWAAYVSGEIEGRAGRSGVAEQHYLRAVDLARSSGATFLVGVATVGLLTVRADSGRIDEALTGYRDVVDYFARTGNWTHLWVTLRNLAGLLADLGDTETPEVLLTAADQAPDAPATGAGLARGDEVPSPRGAPIDRAALLDLARQAIERNLTTAVRQP